MYKAHTHCRACGFGKPNIPTLKESTAAGPAKIEQKLVEVLDLGVMPLANNFAAQDEEHAGYAPLKLMWCPRCTLGQLSVVVNPETMYRSYPYVTSPSKTMIDHFGLLARDLLDDKPKRVLEIGSNDGAFLEYLTVNCGCDEVLGVEPAKNLAVLAAQRGVFTWRCFFDSEIAEELSGWKPDLIIARHVFCHIDDWNGALKLMGKIAKESTVIAIEVPYFQDTIRKIEWDQIYHEHLSYMTVRAMKAALQGTNLHLHSKKHYLVHGGAVVLTLRRNDCGVDPRPETDVFEITEFELKEFRDAVMDQIGALRLYVRGLVEQGKTVVGYGASAKATQWIHACGFTRKEIKWVCDNTKEKWFKLMPGSDIPVVDDGALTRELPDFAVLFAWNYESEVIEKEKIFRAKGGKWIIPVPVI